MTDTPTRKVHLTLSIAEADVARLQHTLLGQDWHPQMLQFLTPWREVETFGIYAVVDYDLAPGLTNPCAEVVERGEYSTGDPDLDYELGWDWWSTTPEGASSDFAQGVNDRAWATRDGRSTSILDSPRWVAKKTKADEESRRAREIRYMTEGKRT